MPKFKKSKEPSTPNTPVQPFERSSKLSRGEIIANNMLGGIFWGIGSIIGIALLLSAISLLSQYVNLIPFIGDFISDILNYLKQQGSIRN
ncbi:MAG TPA: DUF5665 domain-containing protein [Candidatus Levybacteria bacterium]|nr:DUF5665 domain-containing protein [Candidatus Levybacteria bacterium]